MFLPTILHSKAILGRKQPEVQEVGLTVGGSSSKSKSVDSIMDSIALSVRGAHFVMEGNLEMKCLVF